MPLITKNNMPKILNNYPFYLYLSNIKNSFFIYIYGLIFLDSYGYMSEKVSEVRFKIDKLTIELIFSESRTLYHHSTHLYGPISFFKNNLVTSEQHGFTIKTVHSCFKA